jgi:hypothetical protein
MEEVINNISTISIGLLSFCILLIFILFKVIIEILKDYRKSGLQKIMLIFLILSSPIIGLLYFFLFERIKKLYS